MTLEKIGTLVETADAVVQLLNDGEFSALFEAIRVDDPTLALEKITRLRMAVFPQAIRRKQLTRGGSMQVEYEINVMLLDKSDRSNRDRADLVATVAEEVCQYLENTRLRDSSVAARQTETSVPVPWSPKHLREQGLALCPLTFTYRFFS